MQTIERSTALKQFNTVGYTGSCASKSSTRLEPGGVCQFPVLDIPCQKSKKFLQISKFEFWHAIP